MRDKSRITTVVKIKNKSIWHLLSNVLVALKFAAVK